MSEHENYDFYTERPPLLRLEADLTWLESYDLTLLSLHKYLIDELVMTDKEASNLLSLAIKDMSLPNEKLYETDRQSAHNLMRIMFYRTLVPLYESTHSAEELDKWIPDAMRLAIYPDSNEHTPTGCLKPSSAEVVCEKGICSLKAIECDTVTSLKYPDFDELGYVIDPAKGVKDTLRRLNCAVDYGVIGREEAIQMSNDYLERFDTYFPTMP